MDQDNPYRSPQLDPEVPPFPANWSPPSVDPAAAICMEGMLTAKDMKQAAALHATARGAAVQLVFFGLLAVAVLVWLSGFDLPLLARGSFLVMGAIFLLAAGFLFTFGRLFLLMFGRVAPGAQGKQPVAEPVRRLVSAEAVRTDTPTSSTTLTWTAYSKYKRTGEIVLLYSDPPIVYYVFPRSHSKSAADWDAFVALVESKVPRAR
jgi:hypothetical protein